MEKKRELTDQQKLFLEALFSEELRGDLKKAKEVAGYAEGTPVAYLLETLQDEILDRAKKTLTLNTSKAVYGLIDVLQNGATLGAMNKLKAAKDILNLAGLVAKEKDEGVKAPESGVIILPAKNVKITITEELDDTSRATSKE